MQAAHVAGGDAHHGASLVEKNFGTGKAWVDLDAERFGLFAQPAADVAERDDVVAFVVEALRQEAARDLGGTVFGKDEEAVFGYRGIERGAVGLPVGQQFAQGARVHDGTGENMGADLSAFLDQADAEFGAVFCRQLFQANGRSQSGRAAAHDDDVEFHGFALHVPEFQKKVRGRPRTINLSAQMRAKQPTEEKKSNQLR